MTLSYRQIMVVQMAKDGMFVRDMADVLEMSPQKFYRWRAEDQEFNSYLKRLIRERSTREETGEDEPPRIFDGPPRTHSEVMRRGQLLRAMRDESQVRVGPGARI